MTTVPALRAEPKGGCADENPCADCGQDPLSAANLQALAEKVYALLKAELRLERERLGRS